MRKPSFLNLAAAVLLLVSALPARARITAQGASDADAGCWGASGVESCVDKYGNVLPTTDDAQTLGTSALRWNHAYLGTNGVTFGDGSTQLTAAGSGVWGVNGPTIYYTGGAVSVGIATAPTSVVLNIEGASEFGSGASKSTFSSVGWLTLVNNGRLTLTGSTGYFNSQSSITANAFFGDGSHLTGISGSLSGGTAGYLSKWTSANTLGLSMIFEGTSSDTFSGDIGLAGNLLMQTGQYIKASGQNLITDNGSQLISISPGSGFLWQNNAGSFNRMTMTDGGNLGVGNAALATKFDVEGNAQFGSGVTKSTFSTTGSLSLASGATYTGAGTGLTGTAASLTAGNVTTNANLTGGVTSVGNAATVITNANMTGDVTSVGNATTAAATQANITSFSNSGGVSFTAVAPRGASTAKTIYSANIVQAYAVINTTAAAASLTDGFNIGSVTYNGVGDVTVTFGTSFATNGVFACSCQSAVTASGGTTNCEEVGPGFSGDAANSRRFTVEAAFAGTAAESKRISIICVGRQ